MDNATYKAIPLNPSDAITDRRPIVMVGDSITYQGDWPCLLDRTDVTNWGIPGYTTEQISWTINHLLTLSPRICFLEGGINDISLGIPADRIVRNQISVIERLGAHGVIAVQQSVIHQSGQENRITIQHINARLEEYCTSHDLEFLDLNAFLSSNGTLRPEFSAGGTHLSPAAYGPWARAVAASLVGHGF